jgi:hypothetical protein
MAKILREIHEIDLSGEGTATLTIERKGQADPSACDKMCVRATIVLPTDKNGGLLPALCFVHRLELFGSALGPYWGDPMAENGYAGREFSRLFMAKTWKRAFSEACQSMTAEVDRLIVALKTRQDLLIAAEEEGE